MDTADWAHRLSGPQAAVAVAAGVVVAEALVVLAVSEVGVLVVVDPAVAGN